MGTNDFNKAVDGALKVEVHLGDITQERVDAIMVPQFTSEASYGGVGGAVARSGAAKGMEAYDAFCAEKGPQKFGAVLVTDSGGGKAAKLIHVVSVGSGDEYEFDTIKTCMYNALKMAEKNGITSIAAPALGTGIIGALTARQSAEAMMGAIHEYKQQGGRDIPVTFVIYGDQAAVAEFNKVLSSGSYAAADDAQGGQREFNPLRWHAELECDARANTAAGLTRKPPKNS